MPLLRRKTCKQCDLALAYLAPTRSPSSRLPANLSLGTGFLLTFRMLNSDLILALKLLHLLHWRFSPLFLIAPLWLRCLLNSARLAENQELRVLVVQQFWFQGHPPKASEFVKYFFRKLWP